MANLKILCKGQELKWEVSPEQLYSGNIKIDNIEFEFNEIWNGFIKTVTFTKNSDVIEVVLENNICEIPQEISTTAGVVEIGVFGIKGEQRIVSQSLIYYYNQGSKTEGKPSEPTEDVYQQIINIMGQTEEIAQSVRDDADAGKFDGDDYVLTEQDKQEIASMASGVKFYICGENEVDENGQPLIENPDANTLYLTPSGEGSPNLFIAWAYINGRWELFEQAGMPDLTNYVKRTDIASDSVAGVVKVGSGSYGIAKTLQGIIFVKYADKTAIDARMGEYKPIVPKTLDYAVKKALTDSKLQDIVNEDGSITEVSDAWTEEEKTNARKLLNAVGAEDYASNDNYGLIKVGVGSGLQTIEGKGLYIQPAREKNIENKSGFYTPLTAQFVDYIAKYGITTNKLTLTDEEKQTAQDWLGVTDAISKAIDELKNEN